MDVISMFSKVFKTVAKSLADSINHANSNGIEDDIFRLPFLHISTLLQKTMYETARNKL